MFNEGKYGVTISHGHSYHALVHDKSCEWHCFGIRKNGTYKISCDANGQITYVEESPPQREDQDVC